MSKEQIIKFIKNKNNLAICLILIIGAALMAFSGTSDKKKQTSSAEPQQQISSEEEEERLADILSQIDGVGSVSVMITYYSGTEKNIAYEVKQSSTLEEDKSEVNEDKKAVMTDGEPMVVKEVYPKVKGVIVTASGAGRADVKKALTEAVSAALDVPVHKIFVYKKEE